MSLSDLPTSHSDRLFDDTDQLPQNCQLAARHFAKFVLRHGEFDKEGRFQLNWQTLDAAIRSSSSKDVMLDRYCTATITEPKKTLGSLSRQIIEVLSSDLRVNLSIPETDVLTEKVTSTFNEKIEFKAGVVSAEFSILYARPIGNDPNYMQSLVVTIVLSTTMTQTQNWFGYTATKQYFCANVKAMKVTLSKDFGRAAITNEKSLPPFHLAFLFFIFLFVILNLV
ncbi:hypothetical protein BKA62DRAFT_680511 [Auriculariales sp. MPI-PUGE-AT-0066]|nr:hypothetical protein BKA62DRAFT_680511 [Auriculariales sp. MPI-PUGE-AT-0066]